MQSRKRAKPVKFGEKAKEEQEKKSTKKLDKKQASSKKEEKQPEKTAKEKHPKESGKIIDKDHETGASSVMSVSEVGVAEIFDKDSDEEDLKKSKSEIVEDEEKEKIDEDYSGITASEAAENEGDSFSKPPEEYDQPRKGMLGYFIKVALSTFLISVLIFAGYVFFMSKDFSFSIPQFINSPTPTAEIKEEKPTPKPVDLSSYSVDILNGSGVRGAAAELQESLEEVGFRVGDVGNAERDDYEETEISVKKDADQEYIKKLRSELEKYYVVSKGLKVASDEADIVVVIGKEAAK